MPRRKRVKVKVPRRKKITRSYVASNATAINKLGRQVKALQMASWGLTQTNLQITPNVITPTQALPILTDLSDYTCARTPGETSNGAKFYQYTNANVLTESSLWQTSPLSSNAYWEKFNINRPGEKGVYLPIRAEYSVTITGSPSLDNTRVRFDLFTQRPNALVQRTTAQAADELRLPTALNQLHSITSPELNRLNPTYFKKYWTKVFFINSSKDANTKGTTGNIIRFRFSVHPKKPRKQLEVAPNPVPDSLNSAIVDALNEHIDEDDHSSEHEDVELDAPDVVGLDYSPYNTVIGSALWLLISTDDITAVSPSDAVHIRMSRKVTWKDFEGSRAS